jgi:hypothetical protein
MSDPNHFGARTDRGFFGGGDPGDAPDAPEDFCAARGSSYTHLFIGRPQLERVCGNLGVAPRLDHLDSGVWLAVLHDLYEDYSYRIQTTGAEPAQAMDRLEKLLADIDRC